MKTKEVIVLPNLLLNPVYVSGLDSPLESVAQALDQQDKFEYARALRDAIIICQIFSKVNLSKTAEIVGA